MNSSNAKYTIQNVINRINNLKAADSLGVECIIKDNRRLLREAVSWISNEYGIKPTQVMALAKDAIASNN